MIAVFGHDHSEIKRGFCKNECPFGIAVALTYGKAGINNLTGKQLRIGLCVCRDGRCRRLMNSALVPENGLP